MKINELIVTSSKFTNNVTYLITSDRGPHVARGTPVLPHGFRRWPVVHKNWRVPQFTSPYPNLPLKPAKDGRNYAYIEGPHCNDQQEGQRVVRRERQKAVKLTDSRGHVTVDAQNHSKLGRRLRSGHLCQRVARRERQRMQQATESDWLTTTRDSRCAEPSKTRPFSHVPVTFLTLSGRVNLDNPMVAHSTEKFLTFYKTGRCSTVFTADCHWSLCWARWIPSIHSHLCLFRDPF
jgi:hypothetical protein